MKIEKILIIVELDNGAAHQVLASKEHKDLIVKMLGKLENGIALDKELEPINLKTKCKKVFDRPIYPGLMSYKIKYYNKAEGCSFANRFIGDMTLSELINGIIENNFEICIQSDFSIPLGEEIKQNVINLKGNKAAGVVLEDGIQVRFNTINPEFITYELSIIGKEWMDILNKSCIDKENKKPKN